VAGFLLSVDEVSKRFGGLSAISKLSFRVREGSIKALIGPNGAGKSTLFNLITGIDSPSAGQIRFDGLDVTDMVPNRRAALGMGRTFQTPQIFGEMSVLENVQVGYHLRGKASWFDALLFTRRSRREELHTRDLCAAVLEKVGLSAKSHEPAGGLACGELKLLEMARALAMGPRLLLLDEFAAGLTRAETEHMMALVQSVRAEGVTVLLVEHDMHLVMNLSDEIVVLNFGEKVAEGTPEEIRRNERVIEVYLGAEV
jgi:branched-chain amino acid transport system ATP-binding protein